MNVQETYNFWLENLPEEDPMKKELLEIRGNEAEITDRFYQDIVFGTAGLRGICGAGTNRMNELTTNTNNLTNRTPSARITMADCQQRGQPKPKPLILSHSSTLISLK